MGRKIHYIDNKRFEELIKLYSKDKSAHEDELMGMFDLLISNIVSGFKFTVDHDDAKQECFLLILKTLPNFTPDKGSAFNYFTTVIVNNLRLLYTKDKKYEQKIENYIETHRPNDL
jgi:DNA-directed RNA polymerase specialized sigma subunit